MRSDQQSLRPRLDLHVNAEPGRVADQLDLLYRAQERLQGLLEAVLEISRELELPEVLRQIVSTAMELVGALAVVNERRTGLSEFIAVGLTDQERADLGGVGPPQGRGFLGYLIHHTEPLRIDEIAATPSPRASRQDTRRCAPCWVWRSACAARSTETCTCPSGATGSPSTSTTRLWS